MMNSVGRISSGLSLMILLKVAILQFTFADIETIQQKKEWSTNDLKTVLGAVDSKISDGDTLHPNPDTFVLRRRLSKSSKSSSTEEVVYEEDFLKEFEDFYGPPVDVVDGGNRGSKKSKSDKKSKSQSRGGGDRNSESSAMDDYLPVDFSMAYSMGYQPKGSKSTKSSKQSSKRKGTGSEDSQGESDTLRNVPENWLDHPEEETNRDTSTPSAAPWLVPTSDEETGEMGDEVPNDTGNTLSQYMDISLPQYTIFYQMTDTNVPVQEQYMELKTMTGAFLEHQITPALGELLAVKTELQAGFVWSPGTISVRFQTVVSYDSTTTSPSSDQLEAQIQQAFTGSQQVEYLSRLNDLHDDNVFSSTEAITFNEQITPNSQILNEQVTPNSQTRDGEDSLSSKGIVVGATLGVLILSLTALSVCKRRKKSHSDLDQLEKSWAADASVSNVTVAETVVSTHSTYGKAVRSADNKGSSSPSLSSEGSHHENTINSSSMYTSGQSGSSEDLSSRTSDSTSVRAAASFESVYISPNVRFSLNSFERAQREDELESITCVHQADYAGNQSAGSHYPWQLRTSWTTGKQFVAVEEEEDDEEGTNEDSRPSFSYRLSLSQDVKRELQSVGLLREVELMENDDLSTILDQEDHKRQLRMEKAQNDTQSALYQGWSDTDNVEPHIFIDRGEAERIGRMVGSEMGSQSRRLDEPHVSDFPPRDDYSNERSLDTTSEDSAMSRLGISPMYQDQPWKPSRSVLDDGEDHQYVMAPKSMKRQRPKGKAPEFIAPWSDKAARQQEMMEVDEYKTMTQIVGESSLPSWEEEPKNDRERSYNLARNMNKLHPNNREPWWRADEKSMTRRNRMSFKRAHYSLQNKVEGPTDDESFTGRSETTLSRTSGSSA